MSRSTIAPARKARHNKVKKMAKGYYGRAKNCFRITIEKVEKALRYSYRDRRRNKTNFRALWIQRINAAAREHGLVYSQLINGLKHAGIEIDRKVLSELAISEPETFKEIAAQARAALDKKKAA